MPRYLGEWKTFFGMPGYVEVDAPSKAEALPLIAAEAERQSYGGNLDKRTIRVVKKIPPRKGK